MRRTTRLAHMRIAQWRAAAAVIRSALRDDDISASCCTIVPTDSAREKDTKRQKVVTTLHRSELKSVSIAERVFSASPGSRCNTRARSGRLQLSRCPPTCLTLSCAAELRSLRGGFRYECRDRTAVCHRRNDHRGSARRLSRRARDSPVGHARLPRPHRRLRQERDRRSAW